MRRILRRLIVVPQPCAAAQVGRNSDTKTDAPPFQGRHATGDRDRHGEGQERQPHRGADREGFHRHRGRRRPGDQFLRIPEARFQIRSPRRCPRRSRAAPFPRLARTQIAPEAPGDLRYRDRRLLALYFDLTAMPVPDQFARLAAAKTIRAHADERGATWWPSWRSRAASVQVLAGLHGRPRPPASVLETLIVGEDENAPIDDCDAAPIPARPSARTTPSSTSSSPTASWPRCRPPPRCSAGSTKRSR